MPGICGGIVRASMLKRRKKSPVVLQSYQNSDPEDEEGEEEMLDQEEEIDLDQLAELSEQDMSSSDEDEEGDGMEENDEDDGIDEEKDEESSKQTDKPTRREVIRKRKAEREATEMRTVFIGNAPATMKRRAIKQMFRPFGHVEAVYQRTLLQMTEKLTKLMEGKDLQLHDRLTSSNFYVRFAQEEEAQKAAQQMNGTKLGGNTLRVSLSTKRKCEHTLSVFVGNLPFSSTDDEVRAHFSECGPVVAVRLLRDRETGLGRGAGYVQFERKESIAKALHLDGKKMGERPLRISKLVKKKKRPGAGVGGVQKGGSAPRKVADNWRRGTNRRQQLPKGVEKMVVLKRGARQIQRFKQPRHSEAPQKRQLSKKILCLSTMIDVDPMGKWPNKGSPSHRPILALRSPLLACSSDDDSGCVMDDLYAWVPPRVKPQLVHAYFGALPAEKVPRIGTAGEQWRRRQLERQLPPQDADARFCGNLSQAEERQLAAFARTRQQHSLGRASVQQLPPRLAQTADGSAAKLYCHQCKCPIGADGLAVVARAHFGQRAFWHPHCFVCVECQELLVDLIYFEHAHNVFCGRHHAELVKPRCANCDELIFSEECTEAEGRVWHMKHFCCARCGLQLGGRRYVTRPDDSQPVCVACCREGNPLPVCSTCRKEIVAELPHIAQSDWHWHADERCFCCSVCERTLLGKTYSLSNGRLFCGMQICKGKAQNQPSTPVSPSPLPAPAAFPALPARVRFDLSRQILRPPPLPKRSPPPAPTTNKASTPPENVYETVAAFPSGAATMTTVSTSSGCSVNGSMSSGGGVNSPQCIYYQQRQRQMLLNRHHKYPPFPIPREPKNEMHKCSSTEDEAPKRSLSEDGRGRRVRKKHKGGQGPLGQRNPGPGPDRGLAAALSLATSRGRRRTRERGRRRKHLPWLDDHSWSSSSSSGLSPSSSSSSSSSESRERVCQRASVRRYVAPAAQANFAGSPSSGQNAARGPLGDGMGTRLATTRTTGAAAMPGLKVAKKKKQRQQSSCRIS